MEIRLEGYLSGDDRFDNFDQLERYRDLGYSLKLESPNLSTVAFLDAVNLSGVRPQGLDYGLRLTESRFKQVDSCDAADNWHSDDGGEELVENADPLPKEGDYCFKHLETADAFWFYNYFGVVDASNFDYVAFWACLNRVDLASFVLTLWNDENPVYLTYDLLSLITKANKWLRILLHKSEFAVNYWEGWEGVDFDWSTLCVFAFEAHRADSQEMSFCFDDLGAYE